MSSEVSITDLTPADSRTQESVDSAWRHSLRIVCEMGSWVGSVKDKYSVGSQFGTSVRPFRELTGYSFTITNPRKRIVLSDSRKLNFPFLFANFIWTLSGSDKLEMIAHYNERGICFSDDGVTLASAFGPRLFGAATSQFERVSQLLHEDPSTRRAVIDLFDQAALLRGSKDVSCALSIQFLNRNNRLDCIVYMRSQSALMVMPYDLFLFTMIHECMAARLSLPLGHYTHICGSLHYYEDEEALVRRSLVESSPSEIQAMSAMTDFNEAVRMQLIKAESDLRTVLFSSNQFNQRDLVRLLSKSELSNYWKSLLKAFFGVGMHQILGSRNDLRMAK